MLEAFLMRAPEHNLFHLGALAEQGLSAEPDQGHERSGGWAVGVFRNGALLGVVMALRGTGGIYHSSSDSETLAAVARIVQRKVTGGSLSLLSGHASQLAPLLPLLNDAGVGIADQCYFRTLRREDLRLPDRVSSFGAPRLATSADMERLIDFYSTGFYSLARLPSPEAWRIRLSEQLAYRTLFVIEDRQGKVASAAMSSAEGGGAAMLGGVATLSEYRGKGLSAWCVGALCEHLFKAGLSSVALFYLQDNTPAARVYDKLGFAYAGEWLLVPLGLWFSPSTADHY
jgi:predicted GNAT family acetyltransferase